MQGMNITHISSWKRIALPGVVALTAITVACSGGGDDPTATAAPTASA